MKRAAFVLLSALLAGGCKTTIDPIEIDLSKKTPAATPAPSPPPTPIPASTRVSGAAPPAAAPGPESASRPVAAGKPAPVEPSEASRASAPPSTADFKPEEIVDAQLEAYNRRDLEGFVFHYAADAIVYDPPERVRAQGVDAIRQVYGKSFAEAPVARATISRRLTQGTFVVDHESITGLPGGRSASAIVVYEIRAGKIHRAWVLR